jgi:hypothetical protein
MTRRGWTLAAALWVLTDLVVVALYFGMGWEVAAIIWVASDILLFSLFLSRADDIEPQAHKL